MVEDCLSSSETKLWSREELCEISSLEISDGLEVSK